MAMMLRNKRGMFFLFAAVMLVFLVFLSLQSSQSLQLKGEADVTAVRVMTMNSFIKDVEQDLEKGLFISSFRAFAALNEYITANGTFVADVDTSFNELLLQGTFEGTPLNLMQDSTFTDWTQRIATEAVKIGIDVNFTILSIIINQSDPWTISIASSVNMSVRDRKGTSSWERLNSIRSEVDIENFEDPIYAVNTLGKVGSPLVRAPTLDFTNGADISNLEVHINESYYIASAQAPDYLMRLEGDLGNSSRGIESLVNLQALQDQGITIKIRSAVDYIYFDTTSTTNYRINNTASWFYVDADHLTVYEVENMTI